MVHIFTVTIALVVVPEGAAANDCISSSDIFAAVALLAKVVGTSNIPITIKMAIAKENSFFIVLSPFLFYHRCKILLVC